MNIQLVVRTLGLLLCGESVAMIPSLVISLAEAGQDFDSFLNSIIIILAAGVLLSLVKPKSTRVGYKDGFFIATLGWLLLAVFGTLPFILSGALSHPVDAFFETMSGFTTTGASVINDVEALPKGILFWRSTTHWLGGMGIIVLTLALIPSLNIAGFQLFKAEVPGPNKSKVLPRVAQTSRQLYILYLGITILLVILLKLAGVSWFDAFVHAFSTVATGGFSAYNASIAAFGNPMVEMILSFFMVICGISFPLYFYVLKGRPVVLFKDTETRVYLSIILIAIVLVTFNLINVAGYKETESVRMAIFQVTTLITGTGFASANYDLWPDFSKFLLIMLMCIGGCAGSTTGGIKVIRVIIILKSVRRQLLKLSHPQAVVPMRVGTRIINKDVTDTVINFFILYIFIMLAATGVLTSFGLDLMTSFSAVIASLSNVGPGFSLVGPTTTYFALPMEVKVLLSFCMLVGRLEIYTVLAVLSIKSWK